MFAKLKKKVEDLEGTDLQKLANSVGFSTGTGPEKSGSGSLATSRSLAGSTASLSSTTGTVKSEESETASSLEKKLRQRLVDVENEWRVKVMVRDHEKEKLVEERDALVQQKKKMEEELKEMKSFQERCLKVEEELQRLKEAKTNESAALQLSLSNVSVELEDLKTKDDLLQNELQSKETEIGLLKGQLRLITESSEAQEADEQESLESIKQQLKSAQEALAQKDTEMNRLQRQYDQARSSLETMTCNWQEEKSTNMVLRDRMAHISEEKDAFILRNADLSQQLSLCQQQLQRAERQLEEANGKAGQLREENERTKVLLSDAEARDENSERAIKMRSQVAELEAAMTEKNKTIKLQQQRLADMKKTLQKELKNQNESEGQVALTSASSPAVARKNAAAPVENEMDQVNFKYLKHVIFKFLTSREYEAQHLTRAVSTLLKLTADEEKLLKETLDWKMSWFRPKPDLGSGQSAMYIPHTH